jgi:hypothetical protein
MSQIVKLSQETKDLLKVASQINNSLKFEAGNLIKTVSESGVIILEAEIGETFPETFSIYEMSRFLSVLNLDNLKDADLIFNGQNYVEVKQGNTKVNYKFTANEFVTHPGRQIQLPSEDLKVDLNSDELKNLQRMAAVLGHKVLEFRVTDGKAYLTTTSPDIGDASSDSLIELKDDATNAPDGSYKIKFDNLILPGGDYQVTICKAGISKFVHKTRKVTVYVGLEKV